MCFDITTGAQAKGTGYHQKVCVTSQFVCLCECVIGVSAVVARELLCVFVSVLCVYVCVCLFIHLCVCFDITAGAQAKGTGYHQKVCVTSQFVCLAAGSSGSPGPSPLQKKRVTCG